LQQPPCCHGTSLHVACLLAGQKERRHWHQHFPVAYNSILFCVMPEPGQQGPAKGADIYKPWDDTSTQVPVNPTLWAASYEHYYTGVCGGLGGRVGGGCQPLASDTLLLK
jgi:hypothetical protein